jgi:CheY-like chemotaxis protein
MRRAILIVEDSQPYCSTLELALAGLPDTDVVCAGSGREALAILSGARGESISALITDLHMPHMDGFELIQRVRSDHRYAGLPIIVLSGDTDPGTPARAAELGANAYFPKPYSPAHVKNKLQELLHDL